VGLSSIGGKSSRELISLHRSFLGKERGKGGKKRERKNGIGGGECGPKYLRKDSRPKWPGDLSSSRGT